MSFCNFTHHKARKPYRCDHCFGAIEAGEVYCRYAGLWEGDFCSAKLCETCEKLHKKAFDLDDFEEGIVFGELRDALMSLRDDEAREKLVFLFDTNRLKRRARWEELKQAAAEPPTR